MYSLAPSAYQVGEGGGGGRVNSMTGQLRRTLLYGARLRHLTPNNRYHAEKRFVTLILSPLDKQAPVNAHQGRTLGTQASCEPESRSS